MKVLERKMVWYKHMLAREIHRGEIICGVFRVCPTKELGLGVYRSTTTVLLVFLVSSDLPYVEPGMSFVPLLGTYLRSMFTFIYVIMKNVHLCPSSDVNSQEGLLSSPCPRINHFFHASTLTQGVLDPHCFSGGKGFTKVCNCLSRAMGV